MKKFLAVLLSLALLMAALPALADGTSPVMRVVNCEQWVSLREKPDTGSQRLEKVHLGELVVDCEDAGNGFVRCAFGGNTGYIAAKYLEKTAYSPSEGILPNQMVIHCSEWVSLRQKPDTSSARLAKVPLGAVVTECISWMGSFICCTYAGQRGYIATDYLTDADWSWLDNLDKTFPPISPRMEVVNCKDWVSLRELPSSFSDRLDTVPLGAIVDNCVQITDEYVACTYNGTNGYIQKKYLREAVGEETFDFEGVSFTELLGQGRTVLLTMVNDCIVLVQRVVSANGELLIAACYDNTLQPLWGVTAQNNVVAQLDGTTAFIAGTEYEPLLVLFSCGHGFEAYEIAPTFKLAWECSNLATRSMSGSICHTVADNGTIYACGYHDDAPVAISPAGDLLWKAVNDDANIYWPYRIQVVDDTIRVLYDSCQWGETLCYQVEYSRTDGTKQLQQLVISPYAQ